MANGTAPHWATAEGYRLYLEKQRERSRAYYYKRRKEILQRQRRYKQRRRREQLWERAMTQLPEARRLVQAYVVATRKKTKINKESTLDNPQHVL